MAINPSQLAFPQISHAGLEALDIIARKETDIHELQTVILSDPILAGMLIRHANSPLYRRSQAITNVPAAIRALGFKSIRSAVVMATLHGNELAEPASQPIWNHSIATAMAARLVAQHLMPVAADDLEFLGLIHDTGMLVLASNFPQQYQQILLRSESDQIPIDRLELEVFDVHHSGIMESFLEQFRLPGNLIRLLGSFHSHTDINVIENDTDRQLCILDLAHYLIKDSDQQKFSPYIESIIESQQQVKQLLELDDELYETLKTEINAALTS